MNFLVVKEIKIKCLIFMFLLILFTNYYGNKNFIGDKE